MHLSVVTCRSEAALIVSLNIPKFLEEFSIYFLHVFFPIFFRSNDYLNNREDTFCEKKTINKGQKYVFSIFFEFL